MAEIVPTRNDIVPSESHNPVARMTDRELLEGTYIMLANLMTDIATMKREAEEMFSPDKMMEMAGKFLGGGGF